MFLRRALLLAVVATPAFFASAANAVDPTTADCLTASENSLKLRGDHKLRAAREQLVVCSLAACPADIRTECARRVENVNAAIPTIVFEAKDANGNDLANVKVSMDGAPLAERLEGTALSIDPGEHAFHFETAGQPPVDRTLVIREGEKDRRERIPFGASPPAAPPPAGERVDLIQDIPQNDGKSQRIAAVTAAGAGAVGLVLGAIFGLTASSSWSSAKNDCGASCSPNSPAVGEKSTAQTDATVSTVGFVIAGAGLATGAILWFTAPHLRPAPKPVGAAPVVSPSASGLVLRW